MQEFIQLKCFFSVIILISSSAWQTLYNYNYIFILVYTDAAGQSEK